MATCNVRRDVTDSFYRYKMPKIMSKIEGRGNGIKTVIPNMSLVAKSLSRPPSYTTKFFACELGAQSKIDDGKDRYIVNGQHGADKLQDLLDVFIQKFVLCPSCQNPETDIIITRDNQLLLDCKACGARDKADNRHKLVTFILKNPPEGANVNSKMTKKERRAARQQEKQGSSANSPTPGTPGEDEESDDEMTRRIQQEAAALGQIEEDQDDDWTVDTSKKAVAARVASLSENVSSIDLGEEEAATSSDKYDVFGDFLVAHKKASDAEIFEEASDGGVFGKYKTCLVLVCALFEGLDGDELVEQIKNRRNLLMGFMAVENEDGERELGEKHQRYLMGGFERLAGDMNPSLQQHMNQIVMTLYNEDIVEEDVLLKWGEKASSKFVGKPQSKAVKAAAERFLEWLATAEDDSDEEDSEEEDD